MTTTNQYITRGRVQTALLKSIPYFKYWYEQSNIKYKLGILGERFGWNAPARKLLEQMNIHAKRLYTVFTREELEKLLRIRRIPAGATILIFEELRMPIIAYNLEYLPQNVTSWAIHSTPGDNMKRIANDGTICYNIEVLRRRKKIFSDRYRQDSDEKRIREGISLAYQRTGSYMSYYSTNSTIRPKSKVGGVWIFPIAQILTGDLILDFRNTIDGFPETVLRNKASYKNATILRELEQAIQNITTWEQQISIAQQAFMSTKPINTEEIGKPYLEEEIPILEKLRDKKKFFAFTYLIIQRWKYSSPQKIVPTMYTFSKGQSPTYLNNTFLRDVNSYYIPLIQQSIAHYLILQLLFEDSRKKDLIIYANILDNLPPKELVKLISRTKRSLIQTMEKVIEFAQKETTPCCIDITKGVLLLDIEYNDNATLQKLIERKIPIFTLLPDFNDTLTTRFVNWFIKEVLEMKESKDDITRNNYYVKEGNTVQLKKWNS